MIMDFILFSLTVHGKKIANIFYHNASEITTESETKSQ